MKQFTFTNLAGIVLAVLLVGNPDGGNQHFISSVQATLPTMSFDCPNCDLDSPNKFACANGGFSPDSTRRLCVECPAGTASCDNARRLNSNRCQDLTSNNANCGQCGNNCTATNDQPTCVNSACACSLAQAGLCGKNRFCDPVTAKKCLDCPAGTANCNTGGDKGVAGDCEVNILTDANNCGICGHVCGNGETCQNGQCTCGNTVGGCKFPTEICSAGQCVACVSATDDVKCQLSNVFDVSGFCNPATKACEACPAGFADCTNTKLGNGADTGTTADCETNIAQTGKQANCGACGASCGIGPGNSVTAQSCCAGTCKCGKFANNANPTTDECTAAVQCKTTEYCDQTLQICLPLFPGNQVCNRNALDPANNDRLDTTFACGTCNRNDGLALISGNTCRAFSDNACGASGQPCKAGQQCVNGQCVCDLGVGAFFGANAFLDLDPDRDNKFDVAGRPAGGCDQRVLEPLTGFFERVHQTIFRFVDCIQRSNAAGVDRITPQTFADPGFRATVCPGGAGQCPTAFCNELFNNLTNNEKGPYCSQAEKTAADLKRCATDYRLNVNNAGDLTCANVVMNVFVAGQPTTFNVIDAFNFLGCREQHPNMALKISGGSPRTFEFRADTGKLLLGAGNIATISSIFSVLLVVCMSFLLM